ncbi:uncharacterized protein LOC131690258 [Topomyia yanbarensis]|uniref:uncharacterized protein LOC131690258 n=1 Tax=Topomyia yanbarensis TaxID=2498891 RepID=UPI00273C89F4|nr:uncharacterized protein LOC131690258 [Topomyia yanbarensis]XP_058831870.1 uncharacterized protein LOC131690258 [Topomyia yanbarensis]
MRKYQQLALVLISISCVAILLVYKSENNRLKYVLEVVNIFGRNDAASLIRVDNSSRYRPAPYDLNSPLPVWQRVGDDVYVYSAFWQKNDLEIGGTVVSLAVGLEQSIVNFKCQVQHGGKDLVTGKFFFVRLDNPTGSVVAPNGEVFVIYKFLCKVKRDFGQPTEVIFTDATHSIRRFIPLRVIESKSVSQKMTITACVDLNNYLELEEEFRKPSAVLQYFLHHQIIGVDDFIVYNSNSLDSTTTAMLYNHGIKVNLLPYNFPFDLASKQQNRLIIELDCLMRNYNAAKYTFVGGINEYLYPNSRLRSNNQFLKYAGKVSSDVNQFSVAVRTVCIDSRKKIFSDNLLYDVEARNDRTFFVYRPQNYNRTGSQEFAKTLTVDGKIMFVHRYLEKCVSKSDLYDWTTILDAEFLQYVIDVGKELNKLIFR